MTVTDWCLRSDGVPDSRLQIYKAQIGLVMVPFGLAEFGAGFCIGRFVEGIPMIWALISTISPALVSNTVMS